MNDELEIRIRSIIELAHDQEDYQCRNKLMNMPGVDDRRDDSGKTEVDHA